MAMPPTIQGWLPENHLARFVVDIVEQLDLGALESACSGRGSQPYSPAVLVGLLFYGYATGVFSSRKLEAATHDSVAFRFVTGNLHPDHDTIATFRKRFLKETEELFVQILVIAHTMGLVRLGSVSVDGTKGHASASKHRALSRAYANRLEEQLRAEVAELTRLADEADGSAPPGLDVPEELARREKRLERIAWAKEEIKARARERFEQEQADYEERMAERRAKEASRGRRMGGRPPAAPVDDGPRARDQVNLTDPESRIMPTSAGGFEQAYNAQAAVDLDTHLIVGNHLSQKPNDKREMAPALEGLARLPEELGRVENALGDTGHHSEDNAELCEKAGVTPWIANGRQQHNAPLEERLRQAQEEGSPAEANAGTGIEEDAHARGNAATGVEEGDPRSTRGDAAASAEQEAPAGGDAAASAEQAAPARGDAAASAEGDARAQGSAAARMAKRMRSALGKALYAKRKSTVEPVFGIIKSVLGFRQFLLRGIEAAQGEWNLVCMGWNLKRMHALSAS